MGLRAWLAPSAHPIVREAEGWRITTRQLRVLGVEDWHSKWHWALEVDVDEKE